MENQIDIIECPECKRVQKAEVEPTIPWHTFIHHCEKCNYIIMESEWNLVTTPNK